MISLVHKVQEISPLFKGISEKKQQLFFQVCLSIFQSKSVCLYQVVDEVEEIIPGINVESRYKTLINFFCTGMYEVYLEGIFFVLIHLFGQTKRIHLAIDRTDWKVGGRHINLLVIGIVYRRVCIPLVWLDLERKGNSNTQQRLDLLDKLLHLWQRTNLALPVIEMSGDREFIGDKWLLGLADRNILFVLRLKENLQFHLFHKKQMSIKKVSLKKLARRVQGKTKAWVSIVTSSGYIAKLLILPNTGRYKKKEPFVFLITNMEKAELEQIQQKFDLRWQIECCFKHLKSNGFNLEDIRLEGQHKLHLMMGILVLLYALCIQQGLWISDQKQAKPITYADGKSYPRKSIFRQGLSSLKNHIKLTSHLIIIILKTLLSSSKIGTYNSFKKRISIFYSQ